MIESFWAFIQEQQSVTTTSYSIVVIRTTLGIGYYDYNILCFRTYDNIYFKIGLLTVSLSVYQVVKVKQIFLLQNTVPQLGTSNQEHYRFENYQ